MNNQFLIFFILIFAVCTRWRGLTWKIRLYFNKSNCKDAKGQIRWEVLSDILQKSGSHVKELRLTNAPTFDTLHIDGEKYKVLGIVPTVPECINDITHMCRKITKLTLEMYNREYESNSELPTVLLEDTNELIKTPHLSICGKHRISGFLIGS